MKEKEDVGSIYFSAHSNQEEYHNLLQEIGCVTHRITSDTSL